MTAALAAAAAVAIGACSGGGERTAPIEAARAAAPAPADPRESWYQLVDGKFEKITGVEAAAAVAPLPWTVQSRVADGVLFDGGLYLALNGTGLARIGLSGSGPSFRYFTDPLIFPHRTITTLVPRGGVLTAHLYFNSLLNTVKATDLPLQGISLVSFLPASSEFSFLIPPFQKRNPDWEAVGFLAWAEDDFLFEWKRAEPEETRFSYTRFVPSVGTESAITRNAYVGAFSLASGSAVALTPSHTALFSLCRQEMASVPADAAVHYVLRSFTDPIRKVFRSGEGVSELVVVPVYEEAGSAYALLPGGRLLRVSPGKPATLLTLPALPTGFRYTDLLKVGATLALPWQEDSFTDVGAAGLLLYSLG